MSSINRDTLIAREHSETMKGVLMLLIIIGHNGVLMYLNPDAPIKNYLYSFHVWAFFFLPFIYPIHPFSFQRVGKYAKRLLVPYTWLFLLFLFGFTILSHQTHKILTADTLQAFITASQPALKAAIGFRLLWFLPALFCAMVFRDIYYSSPKSVRIVLLLVCAATVTLNILDDTDTTWRFMVKLPLGMIYLPRILLLGVLIRFVLTHFHNDKVIGALIIVSVVVSAHFLYCLYHHSGNNLLLLIENSIILPFTLFFTVHAISKYIHLKTVIWVGVSSFAIYIIHQPVYNILYLMGHKLFPVNDTFWFGAILLVLTCIFTFLPVLSYQRVVALNKKKQI